MEKVIPPWRNVVGCGEGEPSEKRNKIEEKC